jgi:hypothetical protein
VKTILVEEFTFWFEGSYDPKRLADLSETVWRTWSANERALASIEPKAK